jgi:threonine dehydrogenase-like Zn-dependent dehydrogenase
MVQIDPEYLVRKMIRIQGVYNYNPEDLQTALTFLAESKCPFESLVTATFPLQEVNAAIDFALANRPPRVALIP